MAEPPPRPRFEVAHVSEIPATPCDGSRGVDGGEELYVVLSGRSRATRRRASRGRVGTFVFIGEPSTTGSFTALEVGSCVVAVGTNPGVELVVSRFEREVSPPPRWA